MRDGFEVGRTLNRRLAGPLPPWKRLFEKTRFDQVAGEKLGLGRSFGRYLAWTAGDRARAIELYALNSRSVRDPLHPPPDSRGGAAQPGPFRHGRGPPSRV